MVVSCIWGWPKKAADFILAEDAGVVTVSARRGDTEIIRASLEIAGPIDPANIQLDPTWFNLKLIPSILENAPPDVRQITATTLQNLRVANVRGGVASLTFGASAADPLADLIEVRDVVAGFHLRLDCDLALGEVVHDYLVSDPGRVAEGVTTEPAPTR